MKAFFIRAQNSILSAAFVLALSTGANAVLGLLKTRLLAARFGVSEELAIFYTADRIPSLVYSILIAGAFSTIFIPIFSEEYKKDKVMAFKTAATLINVLFVFFLLLGCVAFYFAPEVISALGVFKFTQHEVNLGAQIMRVMLIAQMILIVGSLISSILQSYKLFIVTAIAPLVYNIGMILGIFFLTKPYGVMGPTYGMVLGAIFHFAIQLPFLKQTGFKYVADTNLRDKGFLQVIKLAPPRVLSVLISSALATINNSLAILISTSSVVYLKFGLQLQTFPVMLLGASMASASLPTLSEENNEKDLAKFKATFLTSLKQLAFLVLPASAVLLVLRVPIVRLVYGVSNFPWYATINTAMVLGIYTFSIFPDSANYLISRAFYALKDTATPVRISLITIFVNIALSLFFIKNLGWGVWAVALSYAITSCIDCIWLLLKLRKKIGSFGFSETVVPLIKIAFAAFLMAITLYIPVKLLDNIIFDTTRTLNLLVLTSIAGFCGGLTYLLFTKMLNIPEIELVYKFLRKIKISTVGLGNRDVEDIGL